MKWCSSVYRDAEKKAITVTAIAVARLAGSAGGIVADLFNTVQDVGNSVTEVGTGTGR
ncbi:hypothetical protein [Streptomyces sp. NPDC005953]|uniref:hypothetical protein n=1 Tax=Streptomyces sp. NPDC005953 TaxID=3156719 RepID=UPI0033D79F35